MAPSRYRLLAVVIFLAIVTLFLFDSDSHSETRRRRVASIRNLARQVEYFYPHDSWREARVLNPPALERLAGCIESRSCGEGETTVIILASFHFGNAWQGQTSGEDIWATSTIEAFISLNYTLLYTYGIMDTLLMYQAMPDLVSTVIWEGDSLDACLIRNNTNWLETEYEDTPGDWQEGTKGCIRKVGFEEGIPIWKSFVFHFWGDSRWPLGHQWTLAPLNYTLVDKTPENTNLYLGKSPTLPNFSADVPGYSIESRCKDVPVSATRRHQALALGKLTDYFQPDWQEYTWPDILPSVVASIPPRDGQEFEILATADGHHDLARQGLVNLGPQNQDDWYQLLSESKVLLGVGNPYLSPSPHDALCLGVPYINPIFYKTDHTRPDDYMTWHTQHNEMRYIGPPHVYHVMKNDQEGLLQAMQSAIDNPIDRYIPESMTEEAVRMRHKALVEKDWRTEAVKVVEIMQAKGEAFEYLL